MLLTPVVFVRVARRFRFPRPAFSTCTCASGVYTACLSGAHCLTHWLICYCDTLISYTSRGVAGHTFPFTLSHMSRKNPLPCLILTTNIPADSESPTLKSFRRLWLGANNPHQTPTIPFPPTSLCFLVRNGYRCTLLRGFHPIRNAVPCRVVQCCVAALS
jgi:hypothetical protein